jgi:hypothetical protein
MERPRARGYLLAAGLWAIVTAAVLGSIGYIDRKGFNPSDDGVVLAQSYRILHGQVPHRDFIAIRPAGSGLLHTVQFLGAFPLVESGRIFVLLEIFVTAFIWAWVLCRAFDLGRGDAQRIIIYSSLGILAFVLGLSSGFLFPWTTIDAILFAVLGFALVLAASRQDLSARDMAARLSAGILLSCLAMLCRQSFAAITLTILAISTVVLIRAHRARLLLAVVPIGLLPLAAYLGWAAAAGAWTDLWRQLSGRGDLFQVGVLTYVRSLRHSPGGWVLLISSSLAVLAWSLSARLPAGERAVTYARRRDLLCRAILWGCAAYAVVLAARTVDAGGSRRTFKLFWSLGALTLVSVAIPQCTFVQRTSLLVALALGWTTSISSGANSPVLSLGIMTISVLALLGWSLTNWRPSVERGAKGVAFVSAFAILAAVLAPLGISRQLQRNYRDLPGKELTLDLGRLLPAFGHIRTNAGTYDYYRDLVGLYNKYPGMKDHVVVAPNNAILYPVLGTQNPFPLDWLQREEFVGSETRVRADMEVALASGRIYVMLEKCNSKLLDSGFHPLPVDATKYPYLDLLYAKCRILDDASAYFTLLVSGVPGE